MTDEDVARVLKRIARGVDKAALETLAQEEAVKRYPVDVAKTLSGVRHGFVEGALWMAMRLGSR